MPASTRNAPARAVHARRAQTRPAAAGTHGDTAPQNAAEDIRRYSGDPDFMATLARGLAVVRAFTQQRRPLTIAQLSMKTGIPRAAVRRCLYTLAELGYVASDDGRNFMLRPRILALGHAYLTSSPLAASAQPILDNVSDTVHESCSMSILEGDEILYIGRSRTSSRIMSIDLTVGSRLPAYCTSMGRILLSGLDPKDLAAYCARVRIVPHTEKTQTSPARIRAIVEALRSRDCAIVDQELEIGLRSISVPVRDAHGRIAAAINISVQANRVSMPEMEARLKPHLLTAAHELGLLLN
ncbi:MAG TPA: IclR family transcriptional regulator C-terminal domain-containing protein [Casimicrobiaceae bacterium]|jgi:IclR family pca regulon transcriptional regulator